MIKIHHTYIHATARMLINQLLDSTYLSEGDEVKKFEQKLETDTGVRHCIALNSGTSALHLALVLAGVEQGDEVILPAQTFVATGLTILQQKAVPVFCDIDYKTGNISTEALKKKISGRTKAIVVVHWAGYPCDMDEIKVIASAHHLTIIEDAAHALGATYKQKPIGSISDFTCFSFQAIKHVTTGDGGALCASTPEWKDKGMVKRWFGIDRKHSTLSELGERQYDISSLGYKYHMNNYAAVLGLANLTGFAERLNARRQRAAFYKSEMQKLDGIELLNYQPDRESAYWLFGFHVQRRLDFIRALQSQGVEASVVHQRIDRNSVFGGLRKDLPHQTRFDETQIHIPIHDGIDSEKAEYIVSAIKRGW